MERGRLRRGPPTDSNLAVCWSPIVVQLRRCDGRIPNSHGERFLVPGLLILEVEDLIADIEPGLEGGSSRVFGRIAQDAQNKKSPCAAPDQSEDGFCLPNSYHVQPHYSKRLK